MRGLAKQSRRRWRRFCRGLKRRRWRRSCRGLRGQFWKLTPDSVALLEALRGVVGV